MLGETISHYKITEKLGQGGMGEVYLAEDTRLPRKVALKFLAPHLVHDRDAAMRFEREARAAAELSHPNIATIHEIDEAEGRRFIVFEHIDGRTLAQHIRDDAPSTEEVLRIGKAIADGLSEAHGRGIVHRDIKSSNIMLTKRGDVKILDFGLAHIDDATQLTSTGTTLGTLDYMSPEQVQGKPVDERADLYALGVILYEMLAGRAPFASDQRAAVLHGILNQDPPDLSTTRPATPEPLIALVHSLLHKEPSARPASAEGVAAELQRLMSGSQPTPAPAPSKTGRPMRLAAAGAVVLAIAATALWLGDRRAETPSPGEAPNDERRSVAVMYLENVPDPADTQRGAEILANLLITGLSERPDLSVLSSQRLHDILRLQGKEQAKIIDRSTATEVARHAQAELMITGTLLRVEPMVEVTTQLIEVATGRIAASQRVRAEPGQDVFDVAQTLLERVSADLGSGEAQATASPVTLASVSSTSAEAYRHFLDGVEFRQRFEMEDAMRSFELAIAADSSFVMAYYYVARSDRRNPESLRTTQTALRHADRATRLERGLITSLHDWLSDNDERALGRLMELGAGYPDEKEIPRLMADIQISREGESMAAIASLERVLELDPLDRRALGMLPYWYAFAGGDTQRGRAAAQRYIDAWPDLQDPYDTLGDLLLWLDNDCEGASEAYRKALEIRPDWDAPTLSLASILAFRTEYAEATRYFRQLLEHDDEPQTRMRLVALLVHQGRLKEAVRQLQALADVERMGRNRPGALSRLAAREYRLLWELGWWDRAESTWQRMNALHPGNAKAFRNNRIEHLARRGDLEAARAEMAILETEDHFLTWITRSQLELYAGDAAAAYAAATSHVEYDGQPRNTFTHFRLGQAQLAHERYAEAIATFESVATACNPHGEFRIETALRAALSHYYWAVALEGAGRRERAATRYRDFLDLWKNADPELEIVADARRRLARLEG